MGPGYDQIRAAYCFYSVTRDNHEERQKLVFKSMLARAAKLGFDVFNMVESSRTGVLPQTYCSRRAAADSRTISTTGASHSLMRLTSALCWYDSIIAKQTN